MQQMIIERLTGLDYDDILRDFGAAARRISGCGHDAAWRLVVHGRAPDDLDRDQRGQLMADAAFIHTATQAISMTGWAQSLGGALSKSGPGGFQGALQRAWDLVTGDQPEFKVLDNLESINSLKTRYESVTDSKLKKARQVLDGRASAKPVSP